MSFLKDTRPYDALSFGIDGVMLTMLIFILLKKHPEHPFRKPQAPKRSPSPGRAPRIVKRTDEEEADIEAKQNAKKGWD